MSLPFDIARCDNNTCPLRDQCARFLDKPPVLLYYADFKPVDGQCEHFIQTNNTTAEADQQP